MGSGRFLIPIESLLNPLEPCQKPKPPEEKLNRPDKGAYDDRAKDGVSVKKLALRMGPEFRRIVFAQLI